MTLLGVPNFSVGRDERVIAEIRASLDRGAEILDRHSDADHNRTVFTIRGGRGPLLDSLVGGAEAAIEEIDMTRHRGLHPAVGALDVCPVVWLDPADRTAAVREARAAGEQIGGLGVPVFGYGILASRPEHAERAYFRQGGLSELWQRMEDGEVRPDWGPSMPHTTAGATLVTARAPLAAFNVVLEGGDADAAWEIARDLREAGGGLPGVRAIGLMLSDGRAQVSTNVHDPFAVPLGVVVERIRELATERGARPVEAEIVGLVPEAALEGYPEDVPLSGFDPDAHLIERRLGAA